MGLNVGKWPPCSDIIEHCWAFIREWLRHLELETMPKNILQERALYEAIERHGWIMDLRGNAVIAGEKG
jgi:hypothetical protein